MTPIDIQVSRSKVSVEGQAYSLYVGEGGISVLQTSIFRKKDLLDATFSGCNISCYECYMGKLGSTLGKKQTQ